MGSCGTETLSLSLWPPSCRSSLSLCTNGSELTVHAPHLRSIHYAAYQSSAFKGQSLGCCGCLHGLSLETSGCFGFAESVSFNLSVRVTEFCKVFVQSS